ncbi:MAG: DNA/RNA non-specific endonuclease [Crocinitomicaceae bacterium]|nr:DNA/RNA non-specific endonuclease [Crocinitomicaceae bacterium]
MKHSFFIIFCFSMQLFLAQKTTNPFIASQIDDLTKQINQYELKRDSLNIILEKLELNQINHELKTYFLPKINPNESLIAHEAMFLVYDEKHEQAKWVLHKISTNILEGNVGRTNDFRKDPFVKTGSSEEKDFFLKTKKQNGKYAYEGFGYDRGHLAPSADFRWSKKALSESYFYSNMSPQMASFNRECWADLEGLIRGYVYENKRDLIVYTGPVLHKDLKKITKSINGVSIPEKFFKIVVDFKEKKAIAYLIPQENKKYPVEYFATSINEIEKITGLDFLNQLDEKTEELLEKQKDVSHWLPEKQKSDVVPFEEGILGKGKFNTVQASRFVDTGKKKEICGTVVSTHFSKNKHSFLNLDKAFPKQIFSLTIWNSNLHNFSYQPHIELKNKKICIRGKISDNKGVPTMNIENEKAITFLE